jgi:hypothetical protein
MATDHHGATLCYRPSPRLFILSMHPPWGFMLKVCSDVPKLCPDVEKRFVTNEIVQIDDVSWDMSL